MFAQQYSPVGWSGGSRRGWTALLSFILQSLGLGVLLLLPLLYPQGVPLTLLTSTLVAPLPVPAAPPPPAPARRSTATQSNLNGTALVSPTTIPAHVAQIEESAPPLSDFTGHGVQGATGLGDPNGIMGSIGDLGSRVVPPPPPPPPHSLRVSRMMEGNLIHRVQPVYPHIAQQARIQGTVILRANINRVGAIENLEVITGHPLLSPAAVAAVKQWRYRPYVLNGEPVEVETQITVNFVLQGG